MRTLKTEKIGTYTKKNPHTRPREKGPKRMSLEELKIAEVYYQQRIDTLESKKVSNGGIGLLPTVSMELTNRIKGLKEIKALLKAQENPDSNKTK